MPSIYYGDEAGMEGFEDPFCRRCYPWGRENLDLIEFTKELSAIRKSSKAFAQGEMDFIRCTENECVFARVDKINREAVILFLNKSKYSVTYDLDECLKGKNYTARRFIRKPHESDDDTLKLSPFDYGVFVCDI